MYKKDTIMIATGIPREWHEKILEYNKTSVIPINMAHAMRLCIENIVKEINEQNNSNGVLE